MKTAKRFTLVMLLSLAPILLPFITIGQDTAASKNILSKIDDKDSLAYIAKLILDTSSLARVYVYNGEDYKAKYLINVDKVVLVIKDGVIIDLTVYSGSIRFTNKNAPIGLTRKRFTKNRDYIGEEKKGDWNICLQEIVTYDCLNSYLADDAIVTLSYDKPEVKLTKSAGINSIIDLRLYTDALGLMGDKPNAILQTEARFKQFIHRSNICNFGSFGFQYFKINFHASKFEKGDNVVDSIYFSRTKLLQKSFVNLELQQNAFNCWLNHKSLSTFYFDVGAGVNLTKFANSVDTSTITIPHIFCETGLNLKAADNFGFDIAFRIISQYSPQTEFDGNDKAAFCSRSGVEFYWNPIGNRAGRIFGRGYYWLPFDKEEKSNHFLQVQFGYSISLSELGKK